MKKNVIIGLLIAIFILQCIIAVKLVHATVAESTSRIKQSCNGSLTAFPFTFNAGSLTEFTVILTDSAGTETTLTDTTHYSVSCTNDDCSGGGTVTTVATYASGNSITILRNVPLTQESDFYEGQRTLYESFENELDKGIRIDQQQNEGLARSIQIAESSDYAGSEFVFPDPSANELIGWNAAGDELRNWTRTQASTGDHASNHTDGTDDIQDATAAQKGVATAAQITKLDGIESLADVTDVTNVNAAGATMNADTDVSGNAWVLDEDAMGSDSATKTATQQSIKKYVDDNAGANHAILDGSVHTDSVADGVTRGSIIYGNSTPKWDELPLGAVNTILGSDGTDAAWQNNHVFDVEVYGAGTGESAATNNTAFQAAIDAACTAGGGMVFVGPGVYDLNATLTFDEDCDNVGMVGQGWRTTQLKWTADINDLIHFDGDQGGGDPIENCFLKRMTIRATTAQTSHAGLHVEYANDCNFEELDMGYLDGGDGLYDAIYFENAANMKLDTFIMTADNTGIKMGAKFSIGFNAEVRITNGRIIGTGGKGILLGGGYGGVYVSDVDISGCDHAFFQDVSVSAAIKGAAGDQNREFFIANSSLDASDFSGLYMGAAMPNGHVSLTGVWFASNKTYGLRVNDFANNNVSITIAGGAFHNHLDDDGNAADDGIYVADGEPYISIAGTAFHFNDGYGISNPANSGRIFVGAGTSFYSNGVGATEDELTGHRIYGYLGVSAASDSGYGLVVGIGPTGAGALKATSDSLFQGSDVSVGDDLEVTDKLTVGGATDPPAVLYDAVTRESTYELTKRSIPPGKLGGAMMFFNSETGLLEYFIANKGEYRSIIGELLETVEPIIETFDVEDEYYIFPKTGEVKVRQKRINKPRYKVKDDFEFDKKTGKFKKKKSGKRVTKEEAVEKIR